ncbi:MAG: DNA repair protein RadC [Desulfobacteraceae bacterium]
MQTSSQKGEGHRARLRRKFLRGGLQGFLDYEVIELLLTLNTPRRDCKESAKALMEKFSTLPAVLEASPEQLKSVKGVGDANIFGVKLIKEIAERYLEERIVERDVVRNREDLIAYLNHRIGNRNTECFSGIFLDAGNRVIASDILSEGSLTSSSVYPREVIKKALEHNAASLIFAHNHPSGDPLPSGMDIAVTRRLVFALGYVGIRVHEHLISARNQFYSFQENGYIDQFTREFERENDG